MSGWPITKLGEVCLVRRGTTITRKQARLGDVPVIGGGTVPTYFHDTPNRPAGTITVSGSGASAGYVNRYLVPIFASDCSTVESRDHEALLPEFVFRYLQSKQEWINTELRQGAAQPHVYASDVAEMAIPIPPIEEQRRIVAVLDEAFASIATATANAEKSIELSKGLVKAKVRDVFSSLLGDDCKATTVAALAAGKGSMRTGPFGSQLLHSEFVDNGVAVLGIDNAVENAFRWGKRRFITEQKFQELSRFLVHPGDVIITIMGTCGRCAIVPEDIPKAINSKHLFCITLDKERCLPDYLHAYFLYAPDAREYLEGRAQGSIMAGLNMGIIKGMPIRLPSLARQRDLVNTINDTTGGSRTIAALNQKKLAAFSRLQQSLLHHAFSREPLGGQLLAA